MTSIPFNNARGAASSLQMQPPFAFSDVTMSVFPLRASMPSLENFCRNYLNQDPELVQFRPFIPFVYLVILDYGRMSLEAANMGWVSQREVAFGIPLRWLNGGENGPEFHDWAFSSPFIFVDNELSMSTGREVYGWPKLLARLDPSVSEWVRDPHGARRVFQVSTKGASEAYAGETSEYRSLLSVHQHRTAGLLDMPPGLDAITKPLSQLPNLTAGFTRLGMDLTKTFLGMASDRITGSAVLPDLMDLSTFRNQLDPERRKAWTSTGDWTPGIKDMLWSLFPRLYANTINFKQFRDAANPHATCYQAITAAKMPVKSVKQGGFLGPQNMMLGQLDGGFHIDIHNVAGLPIIESLGLEVASERESGGTLVSTLMPVAPLWLKVDMTYGLADTVIWRGRSGKWKEGAGLTAAKAITAERRSKSDPELEPDETVASAPTDAPKPSAQTDKPASPIAGDPEKLEDVQGFDYIRAMNFFNTARGASEAVGGSFSVPDASVRVLPLKADPMALKKFARAYLRVEGHMRFEAWGDFVYLVISDFKQMNSQQSALAKRRARELSLLVPVKCYEWFRMQDYDESECLGDRAFYTPIRTERGRKHMLTTGFVNAFTYVDDVETAITANEVFGVPSMGSTIRVSENDWLSRVHGTDDVNEDILKMRAQVLPELMAGAKAIDRTLVELCAHRDHPDAEILETKDETLNRWVELLDHDLHEKRREAGEIVASAEEVADTQGQQDQKEAMCASQGLALKLLSGDLPFNQFSLKQFRDSKMTENACYQGLVVRRHTIQKLTDFRELRGPLHVSITDFPTQPITELLGLIPKYSYPGKDRIVRVFEPLRPFSLNGDLLRGEGVTLFERVGSSEWEPVDTTEQIFGWRKVSPHQARELAEDADAVAPLDLSYVYRNPVTNTCDKVRNANPGANASFLKLWNELGLKRDCVEDILIRRRDDDNALWVMADENRLDSFQPSKGYDLPAWIEHHQGLGEKLYRQSELAALMERISPATVLDKILSRQWGKARGSTFQEHPKSDFCIPVSTVPRAYASKLFPEAERQRGYWPRSSDFAGDELAGRKREISAFKFELKSALQTLARAYPETLEEENPSILEDNPDTETVFAYIVKSLNQKIKGERKKIPRSVIKHLVGQIKDEEDAVGAVRAVEEVMFMFFDAYLPERFKLADNSVPTNLESVSAKLEPFYNLPRPDIVLVPAQDWRETSLALGHISTEMQSTIQLLARGYEGCDDPLDALARRAETNCLDMTKFEEALGHPADQFNPANEDAYQPLMRRLRKLMTGSSEL